MRDFNRNSGAWLAGADFPHPSYVFLWLVITLGPALSSCKGKSILGLMEPRKDQREMDNSGQPSAERLLNSAEAEATFISLPPLSARNRKQGLGRNYPAQA
ncbi:hypothetical protein llap_15321 [Limosa lapponica baueri]|uniref:Uncharacterized protein n=1 Tax=Limosa lapponica baueri TaxID=1758121 RepID=A0A2I0TKT2_LIMLA|nr:hypothetical protein llap_15321 [Limosa lapponica baueri]